MPLACTRWVRSTFSSHCLLSSNQCHWLTSATSIIVPLKFFWDSWESNPGQLDEKQVCYLCAMQPNWLDLAILYIASYQAWHLLLGFKCTLPFAQYPPLSLTLSLPSLFRSLFNNFATESVNQVQSLLLFVFSRQWRWLWRWRCNQPRKGPSKVKLQMKKPTLFWPKNQLVGPGRDSDCLVGRVFIHKRPSYGVTTQLTRVWIPTMTQGGRKNPISEVTMEISASILKIVDIKSGEKNYLTRHHSCT